MEYDAGENNLKVNRLEYKDINLGYLEQQKFPLSYDPKYGC